MEVDRDRAVEVASAAFQAHGVDDGVDELVLDGVLNEYALDAVTHLPGVRAGATYDSRGGLLDVRVLPDDGSGRSRPVRA